MVWRRSQYKTMSEEQLIKEITDINSSYVNDINIKLIRLLQKLNENAQFLFWCNPQKLVASRVRATFPQITQKYLTKDIFH